ncbi:MAG: glycosyltransferase [Candidatus Omnitrophica bacterium]|nr:glycosyltransferase [Candidatus Omnitrophota bacterium]
MAKASFIIPSYNSFQTIGRTLASILEQKSFDFVVEEVVVVDSSDDGKTRGVIQKFCHQGSKIKMISLDEKTPPAAGRNLGAQQSSGDVLCFIDSDVYLAPDWLEEVLKVYQEGCRVGCGTICLPEFQEDEKLAQAQLYLQFNEYLDGRGERYSRSFVPSCNLFCDRGIFEKVGGFPNLRASEDTLFCLRLTGIEKIWFIPTARCFHIFRQEWKSFAKNQELLGQYVSIYRRMHYKTWIYKGIMPVILFPGFLVIKILRIVSRISKADKDHVQKFFNSFGIFTLGIFYWSRGFIKGCFSKI